MLTPNQLGISLEVAELREGRSSQLLSWLLKSPQTVERGKKSEQVEDSTQNSSVGSDPGLPDDINQ